MFELFATLFLSASLALIAAFLLMGPAQHLIPMDAPGGRKSHASATPLVGGLFIFIGLMSLPMMLPSWSLIAPVLVLSAVTVCIGFLDDQRELSAAWRLVAHLIVGLAMVSWPGVSLSSLGNIVGMGELSLGWLAIPITCFAVAASMNAVNMVDGVDGLAGALCFLPLVVVASLAVNYGDMELAIQIMAVLGGLLVFLLFNFPLPWRRQASCFLGDTGSTLLGLLVAWFLIAGAQHELFSPVLALFLLAVPLIDTAGVMVRRVLRGVAMSTPGRDHLHHVLIDSGMSSRHATMLISALAVLIAIVGLVLEWRAAPEWSMLVLFIAILVLNLVLLRSAEKAKVLLRERWFS